MEDNTYLTDPTDTKGLVVSTLPPLKWYEFYEIRAVGKVLGGLLSLGGIASIASAFFKLRNAAPAAKAAVFVSGTVSFVLGIIMQRRKYWKDPIAVAEYRRAIATSRLSHSLKEFGWDGVLRVADTSFLRAKLVEDIGNETYGFDSVYSEFGAKNLDILLDMGLITRSELIDKWNYDIKVLQVSKNSAGRPLLLRLSSYSHFLSNKLGIAAADLMALLMNDAETQSFEFPQLVQYGAVGLMKKKLLPLEFLHDRCLYYIHSKNLSFREICELYKPWILDDNIVSPEELSDLFRKEMLTIGLVEVMELYWEWPIQKYADRIGIKQQDIIKIRQLILEYKTAKERYEKTINNATETFQREQQNCQQSLAQRLAEIDHKLVPLKKAVDEANIATRYFKQKDYDSALKNAESEKANEEQAAKERLEKAQKVLDETLKEAERAWENEKLRITREWNNFQLAAFSVPTTASSAPLFNITVNIGGASN